MFGMEGSENFYFATKSKSLNAGLEQQLVQFVTNHKDANREKVGKVQSGVGWRGKEIFKRGP